MEEHIRSLHFARDTPTPNSETGSIDIVGQKGRENGVGLERITDIELVAG